MKRCAGPAFLSGLVLLWMPAAAFAQSGDEPGFVDERQAPGLNDRALEEARKRAEEAERARLAEEARRLREEIEAAKRKAEEEAKRRAEAEAERQRLAKEAEERRQAAEEARAQAEAEARRRAEAEAERQRLAEEAEARKRAAEEARAQAAAEARRRAEAEAERQRLAEEAEARRRAEAEAEAEAERKRLAAEAEARRQAAEEKRRQAEAAEKRRAEEEARRRAAAEAEAEAKRRAEAEAAAERKRLAEEAAARRRAEAEAEARRKAEAEAEAERKRLAEEAESRRRRAEAARAEAEARQRAEKKAEEERLAKVAEAQRRAEAEAARVRLAQDTATKQRECSAEEEASITVTPDQAGRVELAIASPCRAGGKVKLAYDRIEFDTALDDEGNGSITIDLFAGTEPGVSLIFADGQRQGVALPNVDFRVLSKVAIVWQQPVNLDLHAIEYRARMDEPGHVWEKAPSSFIDAFKAVAAGDKGRGFLSTAMDGAKAGSNVEVYTFIHPPGQRSGVVRTFVDYETRGDTPAGDKCGAGGLASIPFEAVEFSRGRRLSRENRVLRSAACGATLPQGVRYNPDTINDFVIRR